MKQEHKDYPENRKPVFLSTFHRFKDNMERDLKIIGIMCISGLIGLVALAIYVMLR